MQNLGIFPNIVIGLKFKYNGDEMQQLSKTNIEHVPCEVISEKNTALQNNVSSEDSSLQTHYSTILHWLKYSYHYNVGITVVSGSTEVKHGKFVFKYN